MKRFVISRAFHTAHSAYNEPITLDEAVRWAKEISDYGRTDFITNNILETYDEKAARDVLKRYNSSACVTHQNNAHDYEWEIELYILTTSEVDLDENGEIEDEYDITEEYATY